MSHETVRAWCARFGPTSHKRCDTVNPTEDVFGVRMRYGLCLVASHTGWGEQAASMVRCLMCCGGGHAESKPAGRYGLLPLRTSSCRTT